VYGLSDDGFLGTARKRRNPEGVINSLLTGLGARGFTYRYGFPVLALELDGDPILSIELAAQPLPAPMNTAGLELETKGMHPMLGQGREEQVAADALGVVVKYRA
jgi:hypothetical protein